MRLQLNVPLALVLSLIAGALALVPGPRAGADELASTTRRLSVSATTELGGYSDSDHVSVASPGVSATVSDEIEGWSASGRYMLDAVSAASVDIVSSASSHWTEQRHVGSGVVSIKPGAVGVTLSGGVSSEPDYLSIGGGAQVTIDLRDKNLTPFLGASYGHDDVGRTGLARAQWALMQRGGLQAGMTFVVDRATIASVQLDAETERGYLAKPYRHIPLFDPGTGGSHLPAGASIDLVDSMRRDERPTEQLPDRRDRYALTARLAHRLGPASLHIDERLYTDSWGLWASTTELRPMIDVGSRLVVWPHLRVHAQTAVSFWQRAYEVSLSPAGDVALPVYRAGDRELSALYTVTAGLGLKQRLTGARRPPWYLSLQLDGARTRYFDTLYITRRWSIFSTFALSAEWN